MGRQRTGSPLPDGGRLWYNIGHASAISRPFGRREDRMIQDIAPHIFDNAFRQSDPAPDSRVLAYRENCALLGEDGSFMTYREYQALGLSGPLRYLFSLDGVGYYLCLEELPEEPGYRFIDDNLFRDMDPGERGFAGITGASLSRWYGSRRFCGRCGGALVPSGRERAMVCESCGLKPACSRASMIWRL